MPNKPLGKGLEALISAHSTEGVENQLNGAISIDKIIPNHNQPRQEFNEEEMTSLINSVKRSGILQPLTVRELENDNKSPPKPILQGVYPNHACAVDNWTSPLPG